MPDDPVSAVRSQKYCPDVDGLRAIAVSSVVAFHSFADYMPGGFIGVDIFFLISGYLITSIILHHLDRDDFSFVDFYYRRIRRIFPALCLVLVSSLAFGKLVLFPDELHQLSTHVWAGAGFISNFVLWQESGYFDAASDSKPLLHLWSLGIEEQFYIFWPLVLWATIRLRWKVLPVCTVIIAVSFLINVIKVDSAPISTFYSPISRSWELLAGALLAIPNVQRSIGKMTPFYRSAMSVVGHLLIAIALATINPQYAFPGWWALLPIVGAGLIVASGPTAILNKYFLSNPALVGIGLISYPLYLWHWPLLSFATILEGARPNDTIRGLMVGLAVLLAWATYRLIDLPIRTRFQSAQTAKILAAAVLCVAVVAMVQSMASVNPRDGGGLALSQLSSTSNPWRYANNALCKNRYPLAGVEKYAWWFCMLHADAPPTIILLGDSRTNDFYPGFVRSFPNDNVLSIGTCGPAWEDANASPSRLTSSPCSGDRPHEQMMFINQIVRDNPTLRLAVMGSLPPDLTPDYAEKIRKRIAFLELQGLKVAVFSPIAPLGYDIHKCYARFAGRPTSTCQTNAAEYDLIASNFKALAARILATNPNVLFFDTNFFCREEGCSFKVDGMPVVRDRFSHLSQYASERMVEVFRSTHGDNDLRPRISKFE